MRGLHLERLVYIYRRVCGNCMILYSKCLVILYIKTSSKDCNMLLFEGNKAIYE